MKNTASFVLAWIFSGLCAAAGLADFKSITLPESARAEAGKNTVSVMFMGVSTLLLDDGETAIMTDGYFSRPSNITTALIELDRARIARALQRAGVKSLAAVVTMHSHFDHALDSPVVAQETGALLVGSKSAANIGRGYGFAQERTRVMANGESVSFGKFKLTFIVWSQGRGGVFLGRRLGAAGRELQGQLLEGNRADRRRAAGGADPLGQFL